MSTERPSKTDSPYTVTTGRYQIETNTLGYTYDKDCTARNCTRNKIYEVFGTNNLRIGLTEKTDIQFITDVYLNKAIESDTDGDTRAQGFGDTTVRFKYNLTGNHPADKMSFALLPYVKFATNRKNLSHSKIEYGIGLPFNVNLPRDWSIGGMSVISWVNGEQSDYDLNYVNALVVSRPISPSLKWYVEYFTSITEHSDSTWKNSIDFGLVYAVTPTFSVDANVYKGVTRAADDAKVFFGMAYLF
ncbi:MAG: transporter [Pseudomonadota bacterium]